MAWEPTYATAEELKAYLRIEHDNDDVDLAMAVEAASRSVDLVCGRQFGNVNETRYFTPTWDGQRALWVASIDDLTMANDEDIPEVQFDSNGDETYDTTLDPEHYRWKPTNAPQKGRPWTSIEFRRESNVWGLPGEDEQIAITGTWGWSVVPETVKQATLIQGNRFMQRKDSPYGVAGTGNDGGVLRLQSRVDPDVKQMLRTYYRWWGAH